MDAFPAFFPLQGKTVIVAGAGEGADAKARLFAGSPATVRLIDGPSALETAAYRGAALVFVAHADEAFCLAAAAAARAAGVPVNVVDRPALCDFTTPALIDRGEVVAAIGTGGSAPLLASLLRADMEARMPPGIGAMAGLLRQMQGEIRQALPDLVRRRSFLRQALSGPAAQAALAGDMTGAEAALRTHLAQGMVLTGRLYAVEGTGPADLLTLRAARVLSEADVLVEGAGADPAIATLARRDALRRTEVQTDSAVLQDLTGQGLQVVLIGAKALVKAATAAGLDLEVLPTA